MNRRSVLQRLMGIVCVLTGTPAIAATAFQFDKLKGRKEISNELQLQQRAYNRAAETLSKLGNFTKQDIDDLQSIILRNDPKAESKYIYKLHCRMGAQPDNGPVTNSQPGEFYFHHFYEQLRAIWMAIRVTYRTGHDGFQAMGLETPWLEKPVKLVEKEAGQLG